jgi:diaminopimelate decarboxylase
MGKGIGDLVFDRFFKYREGIFCAEKLPVDDIAVKYDTPCYLYSKNALLSNVKTFKSAFRGVNSLICYSVKANSNQSILKILKQSGFGADVVSEGELRRALLAGFPPEKIVFAGVGKKESEIEFAVKKNIFLFNIENEEEIEIIGKYARKFGRRDVLCNLRLNLNVDVDTHHYVKTSKKETKFGLSLKAAADVIKRNRGNRYVSIKGFHLHLGSQLKDVSPYLEALNKVGVFIERTGFKPEIIDIGGGFGIVYSSSTVVKSIEKFGGPITTMIKKMGVKTLLTEPGRYIVGNTAVLLCRVLYVKKRDGKNFVIVDAGMNDLIRPAFYGSEHSFFSAEMSKSNSTIKADIVGPICETGDYLGKGVKVPHDIKKGDILVVASAGAYCFSMSSNYNSRPRPSEVMVDGKKVLLIRKREGYPDLWHGET